MILEPGHSRHYLLDVKNGKIAEGLGLLNPYIDQHLRFKRGQMNMILATDNVGKSYFFQWYALSLSSHYGLKWTLWMGEDEVGETMINLIQMYSGTPFNQLSERDIIKFSIKIESWFEFIDPSITYTPQEILNIFKKSNADGFLIDPYTGLRRQFGFSDNYEFVNDVREFCNATKKTVYITLHPSTESGRSSGVYPKGDAMEGYMKPPKKADAEGGQLYANRADDFWILHRHTQHPTLNTTTMLYVVKNKKNRTGGSPTQKDSPICLEFNNGLGFTIGGSGTIKRPEQPKQENLLSRPNPLSEELQNFYEPRKKEDEDNPFIPVDSCPF